MPDKDPRRKMMLPLVLPFILFNMLFSGKALFSRFGLDNEVLIIANLLFFTVTLLVFFMQRRALENPNPNVFIRSVMGGMMIKMAVCIIAVIIYRLVMKDQFSKWTVFASMIVYLVYLAIEVAVVSKLNKQKKGNA